MHSHESELTKRGNDDARLARALRGLPDVDAPVDGWERLSARWAERREGTSRAAWTTLAVAASAVLVAVALMLRAGLDDVPPPDAASDLRAVAAGPVEAAADTPYDTAEWRRRSTELETLLARLPEPRATRASTGLTAAALEDRIALIDEQLGEGARAGVTPGDADSLWRERVMLLDSLVRVRYAAAVDPQI
jgi:hypothetical protein